MIDAVFFLRDYELKVSYLQDPMRCLGSRFNFLLGTKIQAISRSQP